MARQAASNFTGTKGGLTFYKRWDKHFVRTKSQGGKQTQATKAAQKPFALAVSLAAAMRQVLTAAIPNPKQKAMQNRLTKAVMQWALTNPLTTAEQTNISQLSNFQFIEDVPLQSIFNVPLTISANEKDALRITLPAFVPAQAIKAPIETKQVMLTIAAGACSTNPVKTVQHFQHAVKIKYTGKSTAPQVIELPLTPQPGIVTVIGISLTCWVKQAGASELLKVKQKVWSPATIVYAVYN